MDKAKIAAKIKALRKLKGFSQEQLAEQSALSLRTVQRVENEETVPHGDSLRKLTGALGTTPDELYEGAITEDKGYITLMHISALAFIFHPMLGIVFPLAMWILKKDKLKMANDTGKKIINFQIGWSLFIYLFIFAASKGQFIRFDVSLQNLFRDIVSHFSVLGLLISFLYLYNIALVFINVRRSKKGIESKYFPVIRFIR